MVNHFERVSKTDGFLEIPSSVLVEILKSNDVVVSKEEAIFLSLVRWLSYDVTARQQQLSLLLPHVRWPLMPAYVMC
jgi:hypothetical protein